MGRMKISNKILSLAIAILLIFSIFFQVLNLTSNEAEGTDVNGGHIDLDTTWTKAQSPYIIKGDVVVDLGSTLTIEPGVEVKFQDSFNLFVDGNLTTLGTDADHITFTSNNGNPSHGDWRSIKVNVTGRLKMNHCDVLFGYYPIYLDGSTQNTVENSTISQGNRHGIYIKYSSYTTIKNSIFRSNLFNGIYSFGSVYTEILNCTVYENSFEGISLSDSSFINIIDSDFYSNEGNGIHSFMSSNISVEDSRSYQNMISGVIIKSTENVDIDNLLIYSNNEDGIYLPESSNINVTNCIINDHNNGIYTFNSSQIAISNSDIYNNMESGVSLFDSSENILEDLNIYSSGNIGLYLTKDPLYELGSSGNSISNVNVSDNTYGIFIRFSHNNSIEGNYVHSNSNGVIVHESEHVDINGSNISNNAFYGTSYIGSSYGTITYNELFNNVYGIFLLAPSANNIVHHNTVKEHTFYSYGVLTTNVWDDGANGNYWGDYDGTDSDGNGIGDQPHPISPGGEDRFPLVDFFNTRFKILGSDPVNGSTLIPISTTIKFYLSEAAIKETFPGNITISPSTAILSYLWEDSDKTLTLTLPNLNPGELYTVTVNTNATGITGRGLRRPYILEFYTEDPSDTTPPQVTEAYPTGSIVPVDLTSINITFNEAMHRSSTESAFSISPWLPGDFIWVNTTLYFFPSLELTDLTTYTVTIDGSLAKDVVGHTMDGDSDGASEGSPVDDHTWQFQTSQLDFTHPTILNVEPTGNMVDANTPIRIYFSELMNRSSVENAFRYENATVTLSSANGTWGKSVFVMTFIPHEPLTYSNDYTVTLLSSAKDLYGNTLDGNSNGTADGSPFDDFTWSFRTIYDPVLGLPTINTFAPQGPGIDIDEDVMMNFSQPMNQNSVEEAFTISDGTNTWNKTHGTFVWLDNRMSFIPSFNLVYNNTYNVFLNISAKNIVGEILDGNGNGISEDYTIDAVSWSFGTKSPSDLIISYVSVNGENALDTAKIWNADSGDLVQIGVNVSNVGFFSTGLFFKATLRNSSGSGEPINITLAPLDTTQDSGTQIFSWPAPTQLGDHFVEIIIDWEDSIFESNENNNSFTLHLAVGPDYAPENISVNGLDVQSQGELVYVDLGIPAEIGVEVKNVGFSGVSPSINYSIAFWNATSDGTLLGALPFQVISDLPGIGVGMSSGIQNAYWDVPIQFDEFHIAIIIDYLDTTLEIDEGNNRFLLHVAVSPDYAFDNVTVLGENAMDPKVSWNATSSDPIPIGMNLTNLGLSGVSGLLYDLSLYNSTNRGTPLEPAFNTTSIPGLLSQEISPEIIVFWIPPNSAGDYYISLIIDPLNELPEVNEDNNVFVLHFRVGPDIVLHDVMVNGLDIVKSPSLPIHVGPGENVSIEVNASNLGFSGTGYDFHLALFNGTRNGELIDQPYLNLSVPALMARGQVGDDSGSLSTYWITNRTPGTYYVIIYADISAVSQESDEQNNLWVLTFIISPDIKPNNITVDGLPIGSYSDETVTLLPGQTITIGANASNIGETSSGAISFGMAFFNSSSSGVNLEVQFANWLSLGPISANGFSADLYSQWTAPTPLGPTDYFINISVDFTFSLHETRESNNFYILHIRIDGPDLTPDRIIVETSGGEFSFIFEEPLALGFISDEITVPFGYDLNIIFDVRNIGGVDQSIGTNITFYNTSGLLGPASDTPFFETLPGWVLLNGNHDPTSDQTSETGQTISALWTNPGIPGIWYVNLTVDLANNVMEFAESNNTFTLILNVTDFPATSISTSGPSYAGLAHYVASTTQMGFNVSGANPPFYTWYKIIDLETNITLKFANYTLEGTTFTISWGEGAYRIEYNSTDSLGNLERIRHRIVVVDDSTPLTQVVFGNPRFRLDLGHFLNITSQTPVFFDAMDLPSGDTNWSLVKNASGISSTFYRIQNLTSGVYVLNWTQFPEGGEFQFDDPLWRDGPYRIWFNSTDKLGNNEAAGFVDVYLDNTGPAISISVNAPKHPHPTKDWFVSLITSFDIDAQETNGSGVNVSSLQVNIIFDDGGISSGWVLADNFDIYSIFWHDDGNYTIQFQGYDNLGNSPDFGILTIYVDDTPPEMLLTVREPKFREFDSDIYNISGKTPVNLTQNDGLGSQTKTLEFRIFNATYDSGWTAYLGEFNLSDLNQGHYGIEYLGNDNLGNFIILGIQVYLDNSPPMTSYSVGDDKYRSSASDLWNVTSRTPIYIEFVHEDGSGLDHVQYRVRNLTYDSGWMNISGEFFLSLILDDGVYDISYRGVDRLGNIENTSSFSVRLDNNAPMANIMITGPDYGDFITLLSSFDKAATDGTGSGVKTIWHRVFGNDSKIYYTGWLFEDPFTLPSNLIDGNYLIEYYAIDNLGNAGMVEYIEVYLDESPPTTEISIGYPKYRLRDYHDYRLSQATPFSIQADDGLGSGIGSIYYNIRNEGGILVITSALYTGPFNLSSLVTDSRYTVEFWAQDHLGNLGQLSTISVILDTSSPTIINVQPTGSQNSVSAFIQVEFSEDVDHGPVQLAFSVTDGNQIWDHEDGFFNWNGNTMMFFFDQNLNFDTRYTVIIDTGAVDHVGNRLDGDGSGTYDGVQDTYSWEFGTRIKSDTISPYIISVSPLDGSLDVPLNFTITIEFNEPMDEISLEAALSATDGITIFGSEDGDFVWSQNTTTFKPNFAIRFDTQYTVVISAQAKDVMGNYMTSSTIFRFHTLSDNIPPSVITHTPSGENIAGSTQIAVTFSEPMNEAVSENTFFITPHANGTYLWEDNTLIFTPYENLSFATEYYVTVSTELKDLFGNFLELPYTFSFTTESDIYAPFVVSHFPSGTGIDIYSEIHLTFSETMDQNSFENAFTISPVVSGNFEWIGNILIFSPFEMNGNTQYTVSVGIQATDIFGNPLSEPYQFSFTTEVDPYPPFVVEVSPTGSGIPTDSDITIRFNEAMDLSSLYRAIVIEPHIAGTPSLEAENIMVFKPNGIFAKGTTYNVTVTTEAEDTAGNRMFSDYSFEFTTETSEVVTPSTFAWDVVILWIFLIVILIIILITLYEFVFKKRRREGIVEGDRDLRIPEDEELEGKEDMAEEESLDDFQEVEDEAISEEEEEGLSHEGPEYMDEIEGGGEAEDEGLDDLMDSIETLKEENRRF
jgi:parallel beta-helix repeat protein